MNLERRYDRTHRYGEVEFYLKDYLPDGEECRFLLLKVVEQAVRDYLSLARAVFTNEIEIWHEAKEFIYDNSYLINWGDMVLSLEDILDILDLDASYFRETAQRRYRERYGEDDDV